ARARGARLGARAEPQAALPTGEERRRDVREVGRHRVECLGEAPLDRCRDVVAELLDLGQRRLQVCALAGELLEVALLGLVFLPGKRVDLSEGDAARVEAFCTGGDLLAVVALDRLPPPPR